MKIVVIGGSGMIGSKLVARLSAKGHETVAASPATGVDTITGAGLADALAGADVVVDVANSPSFADADVMAFFQTSTRNLLAAGQAAGVGHHVALSVVGVDRLPDSGYMRAKVAQETLIKAGPLPWSILHSTQFFEFLNGIAHSGAAGDAVHLSPALFQPIAGDDVADALADIVLGAPRNATVEVAGPVRERLDAMVRRYLAATGQPGEVVADPDALYFGAKLDDSMLVAGDDARLGTTRFEDWMVANPPRA